MEMFSMETPEEHMEFVVPDLNDSAEAESVEFRPSLSQMIDIKIEEPDLFRNVHLEEEDVEFMSPNMVDDIPPVHPPIIPIQQPNNVITFTHLCMQCGQQFETLLALKRHDFQHITERKNQIICNICSTQFPSQGELLKHAKSHVVIKQEVLSQGQEESIGIEEDDIANFEEAAQPKSMKVRTEKPKPTYKPGPKSKKQIMIPTRKEVRKEPVKLVVRAPEKKSKPEKSKVLAGQKRKREESNSPPGKKIKQEEYLPPGKKSKMQLDPSPPKKKKKPSERTKPSEFECSQCTKTFKKNRDLIAHTKRHNPSPPEEKHFEKSDSRDFQCPTCSRCFKLKNHLKAHLRIHTGEKPYQCRICNMRFGDTTQRTRHEKAKHESDGPSDDYIEAKELEKMSSIPRSSGSDFKCSFCSKTFQRSGHLKQHITIHTGEKKYQCRTCEFKFRDTTQRRRHELSAHQDGAKPYQCDQCSMSFVTPSELTTHKRTHTGERPFECTECDSKFISKSHLTAHSRSHTKIRNVKCRHCDESFLHSNGRRRHEMAAHPEHTTNIVMKEYLCTECGKIFYNSSSLKSHMIVHSDLRPFLCDLCGKYFPRKASLTFHMMTHTDLKPFKCKHCEATFRFDSGRRKHELNHFNKKKRNRPKDLCCEECDSKFSNPFSLRVHKRTHTGEKAYRCRFCYERFYSDAMMKMHMRTKHEFEGNFQCEVCAKKFLRHSELKKHKLQNHVDKQFMCDQCGCGFSEQRRLVEHNRIHTGDTFDCDICSRKFVRKDFLEKHMINHQPYRCEPCNVTFISHRRKRQHLLRFHSKHDPFKPFACDQCFRRFEDQSLLDEHYTSHSASLKPFSCDECGARFARESYIETHKISVHSAVSQESEFTRQCQYCQKTYSSRYHLKRHEKVHAQGKKIYNMERNFICNECGKGYTSGRILRRHQGTMHGDPEKLRFICKYCNKRFLTAYECNRHIETHVRVEKLQCGECGKTFQRKNGLRTHVTRYHAEDKPYRCTVCLLGFYLKEELCRHISQMHT